jgi:hypothetical protein
VAWRGARAFTRRSRSIYLTVTSIFLFVFLAAFMRYNVRLYSW